MVLYILMEMELGCQGDSTLGGACIIDSRDERVYLSLCYCMTYNEDTNDTVVSTCFNGKWNSNYYSVPPTFSELNKMMCGDMNRDDQLCGSCKEGIAPPVYSYDLQCVHTI